MLTAPLAAIRAKLSAVVGGEFQRIYHEAAPAHQLGDVLVRFQVKVVFFVPISAAAVVEGLAVTVAYCEAWK